MSNTFEVAGPAGGQVVTAPSIEIYTYDAGCRIARMRVWSPDETSGPWAETLAADGAPG